MAGEIQFLISGMVLGLAAGMSPGPLLALVISETLKYGKREGFKIAAAPLITDLPIVVFVFLLLSHLTKNDLIIAAITLLGGCYLFYLGFENLKVKIDSDEFKFNSVKKDALKKGVIANLLNPHPYLFWLFIGCPIILKSMKTNISGAALFIFGFYCMLVGSKISIALITDKSKEFMKSRTYVYAVRTLGAALMFFSAVFLIEGLKFIQ